MNTDEFNSLLQRKFVFCGALKKAVERERDIIVAGRFDELEIVGRKKERIMAAVDTIDQQMRTSEGRPGQDPAVAAALTQQTEAVLRETMELSAGNELLLKSKMSGMMEDMKGTRDSRKVQQAYLPARQEKNVFIDYSK
jgi:hypothetical protein